MIKMNSSDRTMKFKILNIYYQILKPGPPRLAVLVGVLAFGDIYWCLSNYSLEKEKVNFPALNRWH